MRNRRCHQQQQQPSPSTSTPPSSEAAQNVPSNLNLSSEIENLFNSYIQQANSPMDTNPLLDNELQSDVTFLVGIEPEVWRIPGHKRILADKNSVFDAMFFGAMSRNQNVKDSAIVRVTDVTGRAFDYFIKFLYNDDIEFLNVSSTLDILHVANKYLCTHLIKKCVFYLDQNLSTDNVLDIYSNIQIYAGDLTRQNTFHYLIASAPSLCDVLDQRSTQTSEEKRMKEQYKRILDLMQPGNESPEIINDILNLLCYNCLLYIDLHAFDIFNSIQSIDSISNIQILLPIFTRSSLQIKDELCLYKFLNGVLTNHLKQLQVPISLENKRNFLTENCDGLLFSIKFLLINDFDTFINYVNESKNHCLLFDYEINYLTYLKESQSRLSNGNTQCTQNSEGAGRSNGQKNFKTSQQARSKTTTSDSSRQTYDRVNSWNSMNLRYIDVSYLSESRILSNDVFLPLSLRSLPKIRTEREIQASNKKLSLCKNKEKRKFGEYVWMIMAFIFE